MEATTIIPRFKASIESDVDLYVMVRHEDMIGKVTFVRQHATLRMLEQALRTFGYTVTSIEPTVKVRWSNWRSNGKHYYAKYQGYELDIWEADEEWHWNVVDIAGTKLSGEPRVSFSRAVKDAQNALFIRRSAPDWLTDEDVIEDDERVTMVDR